MKLSLSVFLSLLVNICFSQPLADKQNTLLWAVINAKGDTSYLFGTFHEFGSSYYDKYPEVWNKFKTSKALYLEQIKDDFITSAKQSKSGGGYKKSWIKELTAKDYKTINDYLVKLEFEMPLKKMKGLSAFHLKYEVGQELNTKACAIEDTADQALMEEFLYYLAPRYSISVAGLEKPTDSTVLKTIQFVSQSESEEDAIAFILDVATNEYKYLDSIRASGVCDEVEAYRNAEMNYSFSTQSISVDSSYSIALDERNMNWLPVIKQSIDKQKTFVAIGMMHLKFDSGLINLLLEEGYKVVPLAMK